MTLAYRKLGSGFPLIILHGLYGSGDNWYSIGKTLSDRFEVWLIDQRNHGKSEHNNEHNYQALQNDLFEFMNDHKIKKAHILGHSMGGKTAMHFSIQHPDMVESLIIVDIAPKSYKSLTTPSKHAIEHLNIINGMLSINLADFTSRLEVEKELNNWVNDKRILNFLLKNLSRDSNGNFAWLLNIEGIRDQLPFILEGINIEQNKHLREKLKFPVLFLKGEKSDYINEADLYKIKELYPQAEITTIFDAGHWLHAEQPEMFLKALHYFFE